MRTSPAHQQILAYLQQNIFAAVVAVIITLVSFLNWYDTIGDDLASGYFACQLIHSGKTSEIYSHDPEQFHIMDNKDWSAAAKLQNYPSKRLHPYVQIPFWAASLQPLCSNLNYPAFRTLFLFIISSCFGIFSLMCFKLAQKGQASKESLIIFALVSIWFCASYPVRYSLYLAQTHIIIITATLAALILAARQREKSAGLLLAFAATIKITPIFLAIYWIFSRQTKAAIWALIGIIGIAIISILQTGIDTNIAYLAEIKRISNTLIVAWNNESFPATVMRSRYGIEDILGFTILPMPIWLKLISTIIPIALIISSTRLNNNGTPEAVIYSILLLSITAFSPIAWSHYYFILLLPVLWIVTNLWRTPWAVVLVSAVMLSSMDFKEHVLAVPGRLYYGAIVCLITLIYIAYRQTSAKSTTVLSRTLLTFNLDKKTLLIAAIPVALTLIIYKNVGSYGFVWDDASFLLRNPALRTEAWSEQIWKALPFSDNYFRPLVLLSFAIDLHLFNTSAGAMHWVNLLIHCTNVALVFFLASHLAKNKGLNARWVAVIAASLYASHPSLVETTSWISGRFDQLCTLFMLSGLLSASEFKLQRNKIIWTSLFFLAAALSKEIAVIFPAVLFIWLTITTNTKLDLAALKQELVKNKFIYASILVTGILYLAIRYSALGYLTVNDSRIRVGSVLQHLLLTCKSFYWYLKLSFWPFSFISPYHETLTPLSLDDHEAWIGVVAFSSFLLTTIYLVFKKRDALSGGFFVLYFIAIGPLLHILKPLTIGANIVHERFLTFALAIVCIGLGYFAEAGKDLLKNIKLNPVKIVIIPWILFGALTSNLNSTFWRSDIVLWNWASHLNPRSVDAQNNLAAAYLEKEQGQLALEAAQAALNLSPNDPVILANYATALKKLERNEEALKIYMAIEETDGDNAGLANNIGTVFMALDRLPEAENYFRKAVTLSPTHWVAIANLSRALKKQGKTEESEEQLALAMRLAPPGMIVITSTEQPE